MEGMQNLFETLLDIFEKPPLLDEMVQIHAAIEKDKEALSIGVVVESVCQHHWIGADQIHSKCTKCGARVRDD